MRIKSAILENTSLILSLSIILGLALPRFAESISSFITLLLVIVMSLSLRQITFSKKDLTTNLSPSLKAFLLTYPFLSSITIISAFFLVPDPDYFAGLVIIAAVPPAIAVVPFTYLLGGDAKMSLGGQFVSHLLALGIAPLITVIFLGSGVDVFEILKLLVLLIIVPFIISRLLARVPDSYFSFSKSAVNICFALVCYSVIGLNQSIIFSDFVVLLSVFLILSVKTFVTGFSVYFASLRLTKNKEAAVSYSLFASCKNAGIAAAFALALVGAAASLPAAIETMLDLVFVITLQRIVERH